MAKSYLFIHFFLCSSSNVIRQLHHTFNDQYHKGIVIKTEVEVVNRISAFFLM